MVLAKGRPCLVIPAECTSARPLDDTLLTLVAGSPAAGGFSGAAAACGDEMVRGAREALLDLSASNLLCVLREASQESLAATLRPADDDYDPRLTTSAAELCVASIRLMLGPLAGLSSELVHTAECDTLLVLARADDPREVPYPIFMRGHDALSLRELFVMVRSVFELCALDALVESRREGPYVVTLTDEEEAWHFVGDRRLVAVSAPRAQAGAALARAIAVAGEGPA
ncbi:MAG: hypothetical protein ABW221_09665 [Vicinamibacteria bacterium]